MDDEIAVLVFDIGSHRVKAGIAGNASPIAVFPSVLGEPKHKSAMVGIGSKQFYIGDEASSQRGHLKTRRVVKNGLIDNIDDWERLVHFTIHNELRVDPENFPVLFSAPIRSPIANEEKICQVLFEAFNVPALSGSRSSVLSLYGSGKDTGIVVEVGHDLTQIVPIYEGFVLDEAIISTNIAGGAISEYFATMLTATSKHFCTPSSAEMIFNIDEMKRKCCYTMLNFEEEMNLYNCSSEKHLKWTFPDGGIHTLSFERILAPELLFKPILGGHEMLSISQLIFKSIMKCPMDTRKTLTLNIFLSGGTTLLPGFPERIAKELKQLFPSGLCKVVAPPERELSTWVGGSYLASKWQRTFFSKADYEEFGPSHIHRYGSLNTYPH